MLETNKKKLMKSKLVLRKSVELQEDLDESMSTNTQMQMLVPRSVMFGTWVEGVSIRDMAVGKADQESPRDDERDEPAYPESLAKLIQRNVEVLAAVQGLKSEANDYKTDEKIKKGNDNDANNNDERIKQENDDVDDDDIAETQNSVDALLLSKSYVNIKDEIEIHEPVWDQIVTEDSEDYVEESVSLAGSSQDSIYQIQDSQESINFSIVKQGTGSEKQNDETSNVTIRSKNKTNHIDIKTEVSIKQEIENNDEIDEETDDIRLEHETCLQELSKVFRASNDTRALKLTGIRLAEDVTIKEEPIDEDDYEDDIIMFYVDNKNSFNVTVTAEDIRNENAEEESTSEVSKELSSETSSQISIDLEPKRKVRDKKGRFKKVLTDAGEVKQNYDIKMYRCKKCKFVGDHKAFSQHKTTVCNIKNKNAEEESTSEVSEELSSETSSQIGIDLEPKRNVRDKKGRFKKVLTDAGEVKQIYDKKMYRCKKCKFVGDHKAFSQHKTTVCNIKNDNSEEESTSKVSKELSSETSSQIGIDLKPKRNVRHKNGRLEKVLTDASEVKNYDKKRYHCKKCKFVGEHKAYHQHKKSVCIRKKHSRERKKDSRERKHPINVWPEMPCTKCDKEFKNLESYFLHLTKHGFKKGQCPKCGKDFEYYHFVAGHLTSHIKNSFIKMRLLKESGYVASKTSGLYQCKVCQDKVEFKQFFVHWENHFDLDLQAQGDDKEEDNDLVRDEEMEKNEEDGEKDQEGPQPQYHQLTPEQLKKLLDQITDKTEGNKTSKKCILCRRDFGRRNDIKRHVIEHLLRDAISRGNTLACQLCRQQHNNEAAYKTHMRNHAAMTVYRCEMCNKSFSDSSNFVKHKKIHNLHVLSCDLCKKKFHSKTRLEQHMEMHATTAPIPCTRCDITFFTESAFKKHQKTKHDKKQISSRCRICLMRFKTLRALWDHMWEEHKLRKHKADCPICNKQFRKLQAMRAHLREEHDDSIFHRRRVQSSVPCPICKKPIRKTYMRRHLRKAHNNFTLYARPSRQGTSAPAKVDRAAQSNDDVETFLETNDMHATTAPIPCTRCDISFLTKSAFKKHQKTHDKKNSSRLCRICLMRFTTSRALWDHMWEKHKLRTHNADCPICKKQFRKFQDVHAHLRDEHDDSVGRQYSPVPCPICKKPIRKTYMRRHLRKAHNNFTLYTRPSRQGTSAPAKVDRAAQSNDDVETFLKTNDVITDPHRQTLVVFED